MLSGESGAATLAGLPGTGLSRRSKRREGWSAAMRSPVCPSAQAAGARPHVRPRLSGSRTTSPLLLPRVLHKPGLWPSPLPPPRALGGPCRPGELEKEAQGTLNVIGLHSQAFPHPPGDTAVSSIPQPAGGCCSCSWRPGSAGAEQQSQGDLSLELLPSPGPGRPPAEASSLALPGAPSTMPQGKTLVRAHWGSVMGAAGPQLPETSSPGVLGPGLSPA